MKFETEKFEQKKISLKEISDKVNFKENRI